MTAAPNERGISKQDCEAEHAIFLAWHKGAYGAYPPPTLHEWMAWLAGKRAGALNCHDNLQLEKLSCRK